MQKVTLTYLKDTPKTSAAGKPYTSRSIKTQEHGDKWLSGFANANNKNWKVGDTVELEVKEVNKDGKQYLNFEVPKPEAAVNADLTKIKLELTTHTLLLREILSIVKPRVRSKEEIAEGIDIDKAFPDEEEPQDEPTEEDLAAMGM